MMKVEMYVIILCIYYATKAAQENTNIRST